MTGQSDYQAPNEDTGLWTVRRSYPADMRRIRRPTAAGRVWAIVLQVAGTAVAVGVVTAGLLWNTLFAQMPHLPSQDALWVLNRAPAVEFVDTKGVTIAVRGPRYGRAVTAVDLPRHVVDAFIAAEDGRFREHTGIDPQAIFRALFENARAGHTVQGGSTITQQLVKNLLLNQDQTVKRKAQEARLAFDMERLLSKEQILDLYLNRIYLGAGAYGLDAAAHTYFGKAPADLTLGEAAMLAAFPKAPSRFAGQIGQIGEGEAGPRERQHYVLDQMVEAGFVSLADAASAKGKPVAFVTQSADGVPNHALDYALAQARTLMPDPPADLVVKLTLDLDLQKKAQAAVETGLADVSGAPEGAAILIDSGGAIRAMVGGRDYSKSQFNRATQARRQPGSSFKTFVYAAALEAGLTPWSVRLDQPMQVGAWAPRNYRDDYVGPVSLTTALALSLNTVAVRVGIEVGPKKVVALAHRFGVASPLHTYPSIALGTDEVTLLDMTTGYGVLARNGLEMAPYIIEEIRNSKGDVLYSKPAANAERIYPKNLAEDMTWMLTRVVIKGTGRGAQVLGWDVAGKTGTSQDWRDAWFLGYTKRYVAGVWVGNDDDRPMAEVTGGAVPARIFSQLMTAALEGIAPEPLPGLMFEEFPLEEQPAGQDPVVFYQGLVAAFAAVEGRTAEDVALVASEP
jgi:penicillin-binding protein 1A